MTETKSLLKDGQVKIINWRKALIVGKTIQILPKSKAENYTYSVDPTIYRLLCDVPKLDDEDIYSLSHEREPSDEKKKLRIHTSQPSSLTGLFFERNFLFLFLDNTFSSDHLKSPNSRVTIKEEQKEKKKQNLSKENEKTSKKVMENDVPFSVQM